MSTGIPDSDPEEERISRLFEQAHGSPGRRLESELSALALSARTFDRNAAILVSVVRQFENAIANPMLVPGRRHELWAFSFEVVRLFQNMVASGQSFLEHSVKTVRRRYVREPFLKEFNEHYGTAIEGSPVCMFVRKLRNYLLHTESITPTVSRGLVDFSDPWDSMCSIQLSTHGIEAERNRWKDNPKALEYLDHLRGAINIRRLVFEYRGRVREFADWLLTREKELNRQILADTEALHNELHPLLEPIHVEELQVFRRGAQVGSWFEEEASP